MASKRIYREKVCANPECKKKFHPHDRRQRYCIRQCRIDAGNDRRHESNNREFQLEKYLRRIDKILQKVYDSSIYRSRNFVTRDILDHEGVNLELAVIVEKNNDTGNPIHWYYRYGLELVDIAKDHFKIYPKQN